MTSAGSRPCAATSKPWCPAHCRMARLRSRLAAVLVPVRWRRPRAGRACSMNAPSCLRKVSACLAFRSISYALPSRPNWTVSSAEPPVRSSSSRISTLCTVAPACLVTAPVSLALTVLILPSRPGRQTSGASRDGSRTPSRAVSTRVDFGLLGQRRDHQIPISAHLVPRPVLSTPRRWGRRCPRRRVGRSAWRGATAACWRAIPESLR
jgi:hypothetical protein